MKHIKEITVKHPSPYKTTSDLNMYLLIIHQELKARSYRFFRDRPVPPIRPCSYVFSSFRILKKIVSFFSDRAQLRLVLS